MNKYISILILWLCQCVLLQAQTDGGYGGFDPSNPPDPTKTSVSQGRVLTLKASPSFAASFNRDTKNTFQAGANLWLCSYPNSGFVFKYWHDGDSVVSNSNDFYYTMPDKDVTLTAVFDYAPTDPQDPNDVARYNLSVKALPNISAGSFNVRNIKVAEGETQILYPYPNGGFVFEGWKVNDSIVLNESLFLEMPAHDMTVYGMFKYAPSDPANPGSNAWDSQAQELIIDDFQTDCLYDAIRNTINSKGISSEDVMKISIVGKIDEYDFSAPNGIVGDARIVDFSRTTGLTYVPNWSYENNTMIEDISLPSTINYVSYAAFYNCTSLQSVTCYAVVPPAIYNSSSTFYNISEDAVLYVPQTSLEAYENSDWKQYFSAIMPIRESVVTLGVNLPDECEDGRYKNMGLELVNKKSGQTYKYVITDRVNYTFNNVLKNTVWNIYLKNSQGTVLAKIDDVEIGENDAAVTFNIDEMLSIQNLSVKLVDPTGTDRTSEATINWLSDKGELLVQGSSLNGMVENDSVNLSVALSQTLAMEYYLVENRGHVVGGSAADNVLVINLNRIPGMSITGAVIDVTTGLPVAGVNVTATQTINGKYQKSYTARTNAQGNYTISALLAPTSATFAALDYVTQRVEVSAAALDTLVTDNTLKLDDVNFKSITGATITTTYAYTDVNGNTQSWYSDYDNVSYTIYNKTQKKEIAQMSVQYPKIVLLEEVAEGDVLELTAYSRTGAFEPSAAVCIIDSKNTATVTVPITQHGGINATYKTTENPEVVAILYKDGAYVGKYDYSSTILSIPELADGTYSLVSMGQSDMFSGISDMSQFAELGLQSGKHYTLTDKIKVESGKMTDVKISVIPTLNESEFYYTGDNTSFSTNKNEVTVGNLVTLKGHIDFKSQYIENVNNVKMVVDLPENVAFVDNSVMIGSKLVGYSTNENKSRITIDLPAESYGALIRFCVKPSKTGNYIPTAYVQFDYGTTAKNKLQAIGSAPFDANSLTITVPSTVSSPEFSATGVATANSTIEVYDGRTLIGQGKSLANGAWVVACDLGSPYNLSGHKIMARVYTPDGLEIESETRSLVYDKNAIGVSAVHMYHWNPEVNGWKGKMYDVCFDFVNPSTTAQKYTYYIYNTQFTFTIDFTNNDTTMVSDVKLNVKTGNGTWTTMPTTFDSKKKAWVANGDFGNMYDGNIPKNVAVSYRLNSELEYDSSRSADMEADIVGTASNCVLTEEKRDSLYGELDKAIADKDLDKANLIIVEIDGGTDVDVDDLNDDQKTFYDNLVNAADDKVGDVVNNYIDAIYTQVKEESGADLSKINELKAPLSEGNATLTKGDNSVTITSTGSLDFMESMQEFELDTEASTGGKLVLKTPDGETITIDASNAVPSQDEINNSNDYREFLSDVMDFLGYNNAQNAWSTTGSLGFAYLDNHFNEGLDAIRAAEKQAWLKACQGDADAMDQYLELRTQEKAYRGKQNVGKNAGRIFSGIFTAMDTYNDLSTGFNEYNEWEGLIGQLYMLCDQTAVDSLVEIGRQYQLENRNKNIRKGVGDAAVAVAASVGAGFTGATFGTSLMLVGASALANWGMQHYGDCIARDNDNNIADFKRRVNAVPACKKFPSSDNWHYSNNPDADPSIDPSGYVYEGVASNRVPGVTATAYYKETVYDMYGDEVENIVLWNAEEYAQKNPLFTDENGMYRWDVPTGLWRVKFEKEGYETTYSEWLPVPPPQLDINIPIVQNTQPDVKEMDVYSSNTSIEAVIEFDKYMQLESLTADNIYVKADGKDYKGIIELLNEEKATEDSDVSYASKIKLVLDEAQRDEIQLSNEHSVVISNRVRSYAGIQMLNEYKQEFDIKEKVVLTFDEMYNVGNGQNLTVQVAALPASGSKGLTMKVAVRNAGLQIASLDDDAENELELTLDDNGEASFVVNGEMLGSTGMTFAIPDIKLEESAIVNVVDPSKLEAVKKPVSSRVNGTDVYAGQTVTLSSPTTGATIYYTLNGIDPTKEAGVKYDGKPIAINDEIVIKAIAVGITGDVSEVATFNYGILQTGLTLRLAKGWNWISHDSQTPFSLDALDAAKVKRVLSQTKELIHDPVFGFVGGLSALNVNEAYKVQTEAEYDQSLSGDEVNYNTNYLTLFAGWNWIGYPVSQTQSLAEALEELEAEEGDRITYFDGFAEYSGGQWTGNLETLNPGAGYMYKSATAKDFRYGNKKVSNAKARYGHRFNPNPAPWVADMHQFPTVMNITADLFVDNEKAGHATFNIGAFVNGECRGVGKYVNGTIFLTVNGKANEAVTFLAEDIATGEIYNVNELVEFKADVLGSVGNPFALTLGEATNVNAIVNDSQANDIYSVAGVRVKANATAADIKSLPKGIYLVKGRKVLVK